MEKFVLGAKNSVLKHCFKKKVIQTVEIESVLKKVIQTVLKAFYGKKASCCFNLKNGSFSMLLLLLKNLLDLFKKLLVEHKNSLKLFGKT